MCVTHACRKDTVQWFHSRRDQNWDAEFSDELGTTFDGKTLTLTDKSWLGTPNRKRRQGSTSAPSGGPTARSTA